MKKIFTILPVLLFISSVAFSTLRRVGYISTIQPVVGLDYNNFQVAENACSAGDTIQLYPNATGGVAYTGIIKVKTIIIGPGFFNNGYTLAGTETPNLNLQNLPGSIGSATFQIDNGSAGTVIEGINNLTVSTIDQPNPLNNITIMRCRNVNVTFINSGNCDGWQILQCYGVGVQQTNPGSSFTGDRTITNLSIQNSVIFSSVSLSTSVTGTYFGNSIYNCVFLTGSSLTLNNAIFKIQNSIFETQNFNGVANCSFIKNLTTQSNTNNVLATNAGSSGNIFNVSLGNVFKGYPNNPIAQNNLNTYSNDARLQLIPGASNPGINAGSVPGAGTATDCGIFGGSPSTSYVLSGIPSIPVYYYLASPSAETVGNSYTVTLSVKSNN